MEYRNCEEYVIAELLESKNEIEILRDKASRDKIAYDKVYSDLQELRNLIRDIAILYKYETNPWYISFNSLYEPWDKDKYEKLLELVPNLKVHE